MKKVLMKKCFIVLIIMMIAGCVSVGRKIDQDAVLKIKKGETTKKEVIELIGSPDQITNMDNGDSTWFYLYVRATSKPASFIPIVGIFAGGVNVQSQSVTIIFSSDNIVKNISDSHSATEADQGLETGTKPDVKDLEENKRPK